MSAPAQASVPPHILFALLGVPLAVGSALMTSSSPPCALEHEGPVDAVTQPEAAQQDVLRGLWTRYEGRKEGDPLRFWYFHGEGKGLYRYGKVGLAHTHSFDYAVDGDALELRFRKLGDTQRTRLRLGRDEDGRRWMSLDEDPREPGARYYLVDSDLDLAAAADCWRGRGEGEGEGADASAALGDRLWIDYRNYATGGAGFHMYQLAASAMDGRGVGWFHRGDFDDWTTESLTYRIDGDQIELFFDLREEPNVTAFDLREVEGGRVLELAEDPRDFWARHRYRDGGRSFGAHAFDRVIGLEALDCH
ncbi:hypothetical protein G6O69_31915 [Pseudenhygromyxa sp. WMMC2535]|uniref:hypothetical protein n=1 Tax=Pseudenhygromyxa sp. WMMC2535 TaxID=2712867 RepID=UPI001552436E|nr:hypothetical protein [Pseudenhygromyxa sp. WMMC2535]NVB42474.1 hypothetical protein [Pseudenhygromyxa sp. WMMC2535]